ncbi:MAG: tRNA preQ1(34) S-adenosylmethionine ribosyltransferase-isomerase QueA [Hyphomicrobiaceae bacterium]|nr:tRNA preQ1(34) S-adenosylmethionine ribosyltransferase-isomerase QueA [Hyphomicrobiaceae bacterium]
MHTDLFDFDLPENLVALWPKVPRDLARLLVLELDEIRDMYFQNLASELNPGDILVFNDTRVISALLNGVRIRNGIAARISVNLHRRLGKSCWSALVKPARKLQVGDTLNFKPNFTGCFFKQLNAKVTRKTSTCEVELQFNLAGEDLDAAINKFGSMPIPPYIASKRAIEEKDLAMYQTIYARRNGAVAAPTAGLHFTENTFKDLSLKGVSAAYITLHVGAGTFLPVRAKNIQKHEMHSELGEISSEVALKLNKVRACGGRIIAVGTTVARLLETAVSESGEIQPFSGETDIFIAPGYCFRAVDGLITNFHLPKSTLFMLVSAFVGLERIRLVYAHAITKGYRFYSYGDSSLLWPINHDF